MSTFDELDVTFARAKDEDDVSGDINPWKSIPADVDWWYVTGEDDEYKEGIYISLKTKNNTFGVSISTEALIDMVRTVTEAVSGSTLGITLTEVPDRV